jgi:hypothetical protein
VRFLNVSSRPTPRWSVGVPLGTVMMAFAATLSFAGAMDAYRKEVDVDYLGSGRKEKADLYLPTRALSIGASIRWGSRQLIAMGLRSR